MKTVLLILFLVAAIVYLALRRPVWLQQISFSGERFYVCSHCMFVWSPSFSETEPPETCPRCTRKMRVTR